ncbi:MAG: DUF3800 domain-containing protein [Anaerolineales bacterium]
MAVNLEESHYFVDEAGQDHIFDKRGNVAIGRDNNSRFFMIGFLYSDSPNQFSRELVELRHRLRTDKYLQHTESMRIDDPRKRTWYKFHAVDDCFEVKYEVYKFLANYPNLRFLAIVRDKFAVLRELERKQQQNPKYRYTRNDLYDENLQWLLRDHLGKSRLYKVHLARRGVARTAQLADLLGKAQGLYNERWKKTTKSNIEVIPLHSHEHAGLQAADYFLWGLQRLYEYLDYRYVDYLYHHYRLVIDVDDKRKKRIGRWYNKKDKISPETLEGRF